MDLLSRDINDLHSYLRWNSVSKYINYNLKTLDIGCNIGTMTIEIAKRTQLEVIGVDIDQKALEFAKERAKKYSLNNCQFFYGNAYKLNFEDGEFDQILLADILEHIDDDSNVIQECYRLLKPDGILIINIPRPNYSLLFNKKWIKEIGHVRDGYELKDIKNLLSDLFCIEEFEFNSRAKNELDAFYNKGEGIINDENLYKLIDNERNTSSEAFGLTIIAKKTIIIDKNDKKPIILHVGWGHPPNLAAGPIYYLHNLCLEQQVEGYSVSCFVASNEKGEQNAPKLTSKLYDGIDYKIINDRSAHYFDWENPQRETINPVIENHFLNVLNEVNPDIVHFHNLIGLSMSLPQISKEFGCVNFISIHNYWMICTRDDLFATNESICIGPDNGAKCANCVGNSSKIKEYVNRVSFSKQIFENSIDAVIAVSEKVKMILQNFGVDPRKIHVHHNGSKIAENNWKNKKSKEDDLMIEKKSTISFGFLGTLMTRKGAHIILEAADKLTQYTNNFEIRIYGHCPTDEYKKRLESFMENNSSLQDRVFLEGGYLQHQILEITKDLDIIIIPPIWEDNAPQTVMESLATGTPVIGSNIGGIPDFIFHNRNGYLFHSGDSDELCSLMLKIIQNPTIPDKLSKGITPPISMKSHVSELNILYEKRMLINSSKSLNDVKQDKNNAKRIIHPEKEKNRLREIKTLEQNISSIPIENSDLLTHNPINIIDDAEKLIQCGKYDNATKLLVELLNKDNSNLDALNDLAVIKILEKNYMESVKLIDMILAIDPNNQTALENLKYLKENNLLFENQNNTNLSKRIINDVKRDFEFVSHIGQDAWVAECLGFKKEGYFLDFGAFDGKTISNTYTLEKDLNWNGIAVEPNPHFYSKLCQCRNVININMALWTESRKSLRFVDAHGLSGFEDFAFGDSMAETREKATKSIIQVDTIHPNELLERFNSPELIDYLSLDVEGCEFEILSSINLSKYHIALMTIEHNHDKQRQKLYREYLAKFGYSFVQNRNDDWFFHIDYLKKCNNGVHINPIEVFEKVYNTYRIKE